jgi:outer membrane protein W
MVALVWAQPAAAQTQSASFYLGSFHPRGFDARDPNDVLFQDANFLDFNMRDFNNVAVGGEWLIGLSHFFDAGLGIGYYSNTTPTVYTNLVNSNGNEIQQDLRLRIVPFTASIRFLPLGHHAIVQPYVGAGVAVMRWQYRETGEFVDFTDNSIFNDTFVGSGTSVGPLILGGVTVPVGAFGIGGEIRYQGGEGNLPASENFAGPKIDLSGFNYLFTINVRF